MGPWLPIEICALDATHTEPLEQFECRDFKQPWTDEVQDLIRTRLVGNIEMGAAGALGAWTAGSTLVGVVAWSTVVVERELRSALLAVAVGHRRRGVGIRLKRRLAPVAEELGADLVVSRVHWDNDEMIGLNQKLGGAVLRVEGDQEYARCIIPVDSLYPERPW